MTETAMTIEVFPDAEMLAEAAAHSFMDIAFQAMARHGRFSVALAGGSTPRKLYSRLAMPPLIDTLDWRKVDIFWGDERNVAQNHVDSNFRMAAETLLQQVPIPAQNIHPMTRGEDPHLAAESYNAKLEAYFNQPPGRFDLVLLGMGADGHTASLFPESEAVNDAVQKTQTRQVIAQYIDKMSDWRITLTPDTINRATHVIFLVTGVEKAMTIKSVLEGTYKPAILPSQLIRPANGDLVWMLDEAAAQLLDPESFG